MILAIIVAWLAYKKAKAANRNAWLWAFTTGVAFIITQLVVSTSLGVLLAILVQTTEGNWNYLIMPFSLIASFIVTWRILLFLDGVAEQKSFPEPLSPPTFD